MRWRRWGLGAQRRIGAAALGLLVVVLVSMVGCKARSTNGELTPPSDAPPWETKLRATFDDDYTPEPINLSGRAPHDVKDQRLLASRIGYAHLIAQVRVRQVFGRGRYQGRQEQYLDIEIEQQLMGEPLVKGTEDRQLLRVDAEDELPGSLQGQSLLLFLRWAPDDKPPYHHHLMPVDANTMGYLAALIEHAKEQGVLDGDGAPTEKPQSGKRRKKGKRKRGRKRGGDAE